MKSTKGVQGLNNVLIQIKDKFRKHDDREKNFQVKLKAVHKDFGDEVFKQRNFQYFQGERLKRYKTPFLKLREIHRSLRGQITKMQKKRDWAILEDRRKPKAQILLEFDDVKNYPDNRVELTSDMILQNLTDMNNEEAKCKDDDRIYSEQRRLRKKTEKNLGKRLSFKFSVTDQLQKYFMDQIQTIQENVIKQNLNDKEETIRKLMEQDVEHEFKEKEFKQALQSTMNEIAIRLMQQYRSQKNSGATNCVPNLGIYAKYNPNQFQEHFHILKFTLKETNSQQFMALRDGKISLAQLLRDQFYQKQKISFAVFDDIEEKFPPPSSYVVAAAKILDQEHRLNKSAQKRGIDVNTIQRQAPNITFLQRCTRSIYSKPNLKVKKVDGHIMEKKQQKARESRELQLQQRLQALSQKKDKPRTECSSELLTTRGKFLKQKIKDMLTFDGPEQLRQSLLMKQEQSEKVIRSCNDVSVVQDELCFLERIEAEPMQNTEIEKKELMTVQDVWQQDDNNLVTLPEFPDDHKFLTIPQPQIPQILSRPKTHINERKKSVDNQPPQSVVKWYNENIVRPQSQTQSKFSLLKKTLRHQTLVSRSKLQSNEFDQNSVTHSTESESLVMSGFSIKTKSQSLLKFKKDLTKSADKLAKFKNSMVIKRVNNIIINTNQKNKKNILGTQNAASQVISMHE